MDGLKRRAIGFVAGTLACLALALAVPLVAGAAGSFSLLGSFVYDDVYGVFDGRAVMAKTIGTATNSSGDQATLVQQDLVSSDGEVLFTTVRPVEHYMTSEDDPRITRYGLQEWKFAYGIGYGEYLVFTDSETGLSGLLDMDGKVALEAEYEVLNGNMGDSLVVACGCDGDTGVARVLDSATLEEEAEFSFPGSEDVYAYFDGKEILMINVFTAQGDSELYRCSRRDDGTWDKQMVGSADYYVSSTGERFGVEFSSDGLVVTWDGGEKDITAESGFTYGVVGDYIQLINYQTSEYRCYTYHGEPASAFEGYEMLGPSREATPMPVGTLRQTRW